MLKEYLNQRCTLQRCTGTDARGQPTYDTPASVPCRRQDRTHHATSADSQTVKPQTVYYLNESVNAGDKLDGHIVSGVYPMTGFDGDFYGCKAVI